MECTVRDLEVMGSNPGHVKLGVHSTSVYGTPEQKISKCVSFDDVTTLQCQSGVSIELNFVTSHSKKSLSRTYLKNGMDSD